MDLSPLSRLAQNYIRCLADFPADLRPEHLDVPASEQAALFSGLQSLYAAIVGIYDYFARFPFDDFSQDWSDPETCYKAIEAPLKLLWALGEAASYQPGCGPEPGLAAGSPLGAALWAETGKPVDRSLAGAAALEAVGFSLELCGPDGLPYPPGERKHALGERVALRFPANNEPVLRALVYYTARVPRNKATQKGIIYEVFYRADFRPLLPGYTFRLPHLPADEQEVLRSFDPPALALWREITGFMARRHPQYKLYFRVPRLRQRGWVADYSLKGKDYGSWSIFTGEEGVYVRVVLNDKSLHALLEHLDQFSPHFRENYLAAVACKDCVRCGKHIFFTRGDKVHRLCKTPWYFSPYLRLEDLPDIERLVDFRLAN